MLINRFKVLLTASALGLAGCSTPMPPDRGCGVPGGLCAPTVPNTSVAPPVPHPLAAPEPPPARTMPVEPPPPAYGAAGGPVRIGLLLPLESPALGQAAEAVRAGFMAGHERDRTGVEVDVIATGDDAAGALDAYRVASERNDIVVGPLARSAVAALALSGAVGKPTVALNHPQTGQPLPPQMLVAGLSVEEEAIQVANWAANENPDARALVLTGPASWQQRAVGAFAARWSTLGRSYKVVELPVADGYVDPNALAELRAQLQLERSELESLNAGSPGTGTVRADAALPDAGSLAAGRPTVIFAALGAQQLRQVRTALGTSTPTYGTSSVNPGRDPGVSAPELDGVRLVDLPWNVLPDHPQVMAYPRLLDTGQLLDMQRLYALGIDAFRVAREMAQRPGQPFRLDGVTGRLAVDPTREGVRFHRNQAQVVYRDGGFFEPVVTAP